VAASRASSQQSRTCSSASYPLQIPNQKGGPKGITHARFVEDNVFACFRAGGGVPYARFERFHEVMAEDNGQIVLPVLKSHILPLVPGLDAQ
jgi:hypothetical protein